MPDTILSTEDAGAKKKNHFQPNETGRSCQVATNYIVTNGRVSSGGKRTSLKNLWEIPETSEKTLTRWNKDTSEKHSGQRKQHLQRLQGKNEHSSLEKLKLLTAEVIMKMIMTNLCCMPKICTGSQQQSYGYCYSQIIGKETDLKKLTCSTLECFKFAFDVEISCWNLCPFFLQFYWEITDISLCMLKVYNMMVWFTCFMKWWP